MFHQCRTPEDYKIKIYKFKERGHIYEKIIDLIRVGYHAFELLVFV